MNNTQIKHTQTIHKLYMNPASIIHFVCRNILRSLKPPNPPFEASKLSVCSLQTPCQQRPDNLSAASRHIT